MVRSARHRAKRDGLDFDLDAEWVQGKLEVGLCEATNLPFDLGPKDESERGWNASLSPTIHRYRPRGGYTKDNCMVVTWCFNEIAGHYDPATLRHIFRAGYQSYTNRYQRERLS